jgi:hypothetical protein
VTDREDGRPSGLDPEQRQTIFGLVLGGLRATHDRDPRPPASPLGGRVTGPPDDPQHLADDPGEDRLVREDGR